MFRQQLGYYQLVLLNKTRMPMLSFYTHLKYSVFNSCIFFYPAANLASEGLKLKDIILVHLYMKSMKDFSVINSVYVTEFDLCPPAR